MILSWNTKAMWRLMSLIAAKSLVQRSVDNMNLRPLSLTPDWWLAIVKAYNGHVPKTTGLPKRTDQSKTLHPYCLLQWLPAAPHLSSLFLKNHKTSNASHVVHFYTITIQQMARSLLVPELHNLCTLPASKCNLFFDLKRMKKMHSSSFWITYQSLPKN